MGVLRAFDQKWFTWKVSAFLAAFGPFSITHLLLPAIEFWVDSSRGFLLLPHALYTLAAQFVIAFILFRYLENIRDSSITAWYVAAIFGFILLYLCAPFAVGLFN